MTGQYPGTRYRPATVRCLVIDNHDSFTHNLTQSLACLTGSEPVIVRNDEPTWRDEQLAGFDCVVISPGPGRPDVLADFGICRSVIDAVRVPLLGVCLGHQGICHAFGGSVIPAPAPVHGRVSLVGHDGDELFAGVPSPFRAVRYHSLVAGHVPADLRVIATTQDGLAMAVRHVRRPIWGVQFHPESICTEHGERLLANFVRLARQEQFDRPARALPAVTPAPLRRTARTRAALRVLTRQVSCAAAAESVFGALYRGSERSFWLDSGCQLGEAGRFSFMGDTSGPLARTASADVRAQLTTVTSADGVHQIPGSFFDWLRADLAEHEARLPPLPFGFGLGWVGYLGYELKAETGGADAHRSVFPDASMIFADRAIAFDHQAGAVTLLALARAGQEASAKRWLDDTERLLGKLDEPSGRGGGETGARHRVGQLRLRHSPAAYVDLIETCQRLILAGETYEVCLTNLIEASAALDPWAAYLALRRHNPVPYGAFLRFGDLAVLSSSPERFVKIGADGTAESRPIKGTRARGLTPAEDARLADDLAASEKDRAENLMIVDLVRNDLGVTAAPGSVTVERLFEVQTFSTVHQLVSTIRATLRPGVHAVDCVRAAFPAGSMTGAPKIRTMRIIDALEAGPRGIYSGAIGYFSLSGAADLAVAIRTLTVRPDAISYGTGGAIVALSDPVAEFDETAVKAMPLLGLLGRGFPATPHPSPTS